MAFFAFGPELIVVSNSQLNQVLSTGKLDVDKIAADGSNCVSGKPIIFLKVCDEINTLFMQHQGDDFLIIADLNSVVANTKKGLDDAKRVVLDLGTDDVRQISVAPSSQT